MSSIYDDAPPDPTIIVTDCEGQPLAVGDVVVWGDGERATVTEITDVDGDVDDDTGRSILIPPAVTVHFVNGGIGTTPCYSERHHWDEWVFATDDIRKVTP